MGLKLGRAIPNDSGRMSAYFDDDPKLLNCEIAQPSQWLSLKLDVVLPRADFLFPLVADWTGDGVVVRWFVGTVPDILGLVWPSFRPKSGPKSQISGRILKSVRGPFSSAELRPSLHQSPYRIVGRAFGYP